MASFSAKYDVNDFVPAREEELQIVERIKAQIADDAETATFPFTDIALLRFLRGRKNEPDAVKSIKSFVSWYKEKDVENILNQTHQFQRIIDRNIAVCGPYYDKGKRPICYVYPHRHNKNDRELKEMELFIIYTLTNLLKLAKPEEERIVIIHDFGQFTLQCMDFESSRLMTSIVDPKYPEILHYALMVDAPYIFSACWAIIKPWIDPVTAAKIKFIKREELINYVDADSIPEDIIPRKDL